jgi:hypothetical protein
MAEDPAVDPEAEAVDPPAWSSSSIHPLRRTPERSPLPEETAAVDQTEPDHLEPPAVEVLARHHGPQMEVMEETRTEEPDRPEATPAETEPEPEEDQGRHPLPIQPEEPAAEAWAESSLKTWK